MKATIIREDGLVGVDGVFRKVDLSGMDPNIRAVQWKGETGHIEFESGPNRLVADIEPFQPFIDLWAAASPPDPTSEDRVRAAHARINAAYETAYAELIAGYPPSEVASWEQQLAEAEEWLENDNAKTPWLKGAASARGISMANMVAKVKRKADQFSPLYGALTGRRQVLRDRIDALGSSPTQAQLDAVQW